MSVCHKNHEMPIV